MTTQETEYRREENDVLVFEDGTVLHVFHALEEAFPNLGEDQLLSQKKPCSPVARNRWLFAGV